MSVKKNNRSHRNLVRNTEAEISTPEGSIGFLATAFGLSMSGQSPSRAIEQQEASEQSNLAMSEVLPTKGTGGIDGDRLKTLGFELGDQVSGDPLFRFVRLPQGWKKVPTSHHLWTDLVDEKGRKRASIFYKGAFYDRDAFMRLTRRYEVGRNYEGDNYDRGKVEYVVRDAGKVVFTAPATMLTPGLQGREFGREIDAAEKAGQKACESWLLEQGITDWQSETANWD